MRSLFDMNNIVFRTLSRMGNLILLNLMFVLCCLPVVTIGAAWTAMYSVTLKMVKNEEGYLWKDYWKAFRSNFKQASVIWCILLMFGAALGIDLHILKGMEGTWAQVLQTALFMVLFLYLMVLAYVFPILAQFENRLPDTVRNALILSVAKLPFTLLMLSVTAVMVRITFFNAATLAYGIFAWLYIGFSLTAYVSSFLFRRIFHNCGAGTNVRENEQM